MQPEERYGDFLLYVLPWIGVSPEPIRDILGKDFDPTRDISVSELW
jgi:hypothetical protein